MCANSVREWFWKMDIHSYSQPFPRDIGRLRYPKAHSWKDYIMYVTKSVLEKDDAYVAVYSDEDIKTKVNKIFVDIDVADDLKQLWNNMRPFIRFFWDNLLVFFSGKKGFHVIIFVEPIPFDELNENRRRIYEVISTWCQTRIDAQTFLDKRRIFRISFTYHTKGERWKIPVHYTWSMEKILYASIHLNEIDFSPCMKNVVPLDYKIFLREPYEVIEEQFM